MSASVKFSAIMERLVCSGDFPAFSGYAVEDQFRPGETDDDAVARNMNAAFLLSLSACKNRDKASEYLRESLNSQTRSDMARFFLNGVEQIMHELEERCAVDHAFERELDDLYGSLSSLPHHELALKVRNLFFPEGNFNINDTGEAVRSLREKRRIDITHLNENHITAPARQIIFTSNVLLTVPPANKNIDELDLPFPVKESLREIVKKDQLYWYDHPVPMGVAPESNEVIYGLGRLDEALTFEKQTGRMDWPDFITCVLSVSVTHEGMHDISREYLTHELKNNCRLKNIRIFVLTEKDCEKIMNDIILPSAKMLGIRAGADLLTEIFGVDGEYGRHYTFLKAISAFWQVFIDENMLATFKIDLDQAFPQRELVAETGESAFGHLMTPLWGADGTDGRGNMVHLGMIAGALVNDRDIGASVHTPDVTFEKPRDDGEALVFNSRLPQALSTEAEMTARYGEGFDFDGVLSVIQRVHVTGGTNGILIGSLRKYRPFTPSFVGRAEDQAYLMSVLFRYRDSGFLRYVHKDGLIMRHDKESFAGDAIETARLGKIIGDYVRILIFSRYAALLPWESGDIKEALDPFTGCFISRIPVTVVFLRLALRTVELFHEGSSDGARLLKLGVERLYPFVAVEEEALLKTRFEREEAGWSLFYDILDGMELMLKKKDAAAATISQKAQDIIEECLVHL